MRPLPALLAILALLLLGPSTRGTSIAPTLTTQSAVSPPASPPPLSLQLGFAGLYRPGDYAPLYLTYTHPHPSSPVQGMAEIHSYQDARGSVVLTAPVPLQPGTHTYILPCPTGYLTEGMGVLLRDADGRVLASQSLANSTSATAVTASRTGAGTPARLAIICSPRADTGATTPGDFVGAPMPISHLPDWPELYESLDLLVLTGTTLTDLTPAQANAIIAYLRAGGRVLICTPPESLDDTSPLYSLLPALPGPLATFTINGSQITGRALIPHTTPESQTPDTERRLPSPQSSALSPLAFSCPIGLGTLYLSPVPLTTSTREYHGSLIGSLRPRLSLDLPLLPAERSFPWKSLGAVLLTAGLLLGPGEAVIRRAHNLWPWRWWTVTGWLLLLPATALLPTPTARPPISPVTLVDQTSEASVATTTFDLSRTTNSPPGLTRVLAPLQVSGTAHSLTHLSFLAGTTTPVHAPPYSAALTTSLAAGSPAITVTAVGRDSFRVLPAPQEAYLETSAGAIKGVAQGDLWSFSNSGPISLPDPFAAARRLTPIRSVQLQNRISANTGLLWTRTGQTITRTLVTLP